MIYFCIPAYNEEQTVGVLLWKIRQVMTTYPRDYQVLVVDDASTDATSEVLEPYRRVLPLTVFRHDTRRGYAASLERLLREAVDRTSYPRRDVAVVLQADFTDEPEEIPALLKKIESGADLVTSTPVDERAGAPRAVRWARKIVGYFLGRIEWPETVSDPLSGFRAYRLVCIQKALRDRNGRPLLEREGWAANAELLQTVIPYARRIDETTVNLHYDRRRRPSRVRPWRALKQFFALLRSGEDKAPEVGAALKRRRKKRRSGGRSGRRKGRSDPSSTAADGAASRNGARRRKGGRKGGGRGRRGRGGRRREPGPGKDQHGSTASGGA